MASIRNKISTRRARARALNDQLAAADTGSRLDRWDWPDARFTPEVLRRIGALEDDADEGRMSG